MFQKDIRNAERDNRKLKLETEEYKTLEYSESREAVLEAERGRLQREFEGPGKEWADCEIEEGRLNERIAIATEVLKGKSIVPREAICG